MKILKRGKVPNDTHKFKCKNCCTTFIAEQGVFSTHTLLEIGELGTEYESKRPLCGKAVFHYKNH